MIFFRFNFQRSIWPGTQVTPSSDLQLKNWVYVLRPFCFCFVNWDNLWWAERLHFANSCRHVPVSIRLIVLFKWFHHQQLTSVILASSCTKSFKFLCQNGNAKQKVWASCHCFYFLNIITIFCSFLREYFTCQKLEQEFEAFHWNGIYEELICRRAKWADQSKQFGSISPTYFLVIHTAYEDMLEIEIVKFQQLK